MKVVCIIVPPGGGEADYQLGFDLPAVPQLGDYISVMRKGDEAAGYEHFIVRRIRWELEFPEAAAVGTADNQPYGKAQTIWVECEFAHGPWASESHKRACEGYESRGFPIQTLEASAY